MRSFRTDIERDVGERIEDIFVACQDSVEVQLENFPKYVRRQHLKRFLSMYEIFKLVLPVKGSVIDCGVYKGFSLMAWAKLSAILEPENLTRRIYGFDTFKGFDGNFESEHSYAELMSLIKEYDRDRFLGHIDKVHIVNGDIMETAPKFIEMNPHLLVSLLYLDLDLYEPTRKALEIFLLRMPAGGVVAFDELDNPQWPGETTAMLEEMIGFYHSGERKRARLQRIEWDPYISYVVLE